MHITMWMSNMESAELTTLFVDGKELVSIMFMDNLVQLHAPRVSDVHSDI